MPLSVFQYQPPTHFREVIDLADDYGHTFGSEASSFGIRFVNGDPIHLIYRLNQADPTVSIGIPNVRWLPLCYHFSYASFDRKLVYRVLNDSEVQVIAPTEAVFDPHFPRSDFPHSFPLSSVSFRKVPYQPTIAEDALKLAAVFGLDRLSDSEMRRAVVIADKTSGTISDWGLPDWEPRDILRAAHREPFSQGKPSKSCDNPDCTAEIAYRTAPITIAIDSEAVREVTGQSTLTLEARDVRRNSMRVFAIHQPQNGDDRVWPHMQLIF
jgi:hypothetical protein